VNKVIGPVDWDHCTARNMPAIWRDAEKNPSAYEFRELFQVISIAMYEGWPYWESRPAILFRGPTGPEWTYFDDYGVSPESIRLRTRTEEK
jgi:hypothetical protein